MRLWKLWFHELFKDEYKLIVNADKTENTKVGHLDMGVDQSAWRGTRKLGPLLGHRGKEDVARRIQLANVSFGKLEALWKHRSYVAKAIRLQSYRALVESVLLYNCGTHVGAFFCFSRSFRPRSKENAAQSHGTNMEAQSYERGFECYVWLSTR